MISRAQGISIVFSGVLMAIALIGVAVIIEGTKQSKWVDECIVVYFEMRDSAIRTDIKQYCKAKRRLL